MKKVCGLILLGTIILFTGCTKNMVTCSDDSGESYNTMYDIYFNKQDNIKKIDVRLVASDTNDIEDMCEMFENYVEETEGTTIKCTDEGLLITGYEKTDDGYTEYNKDDIIELMEDDGYSCN